MPDNERFPEHCRRLLEEQHKIGWNNLFRGKFSKEWNKIQRKYIASYMSRKPTELIILNKRTNIVVGIFNEIYEMSHKMWKDRCNDRHKCTNGRPSPAAFLEVEREVRSLYAMKESVLTTDHIAFTDDIEIHLGHSLQKLRAWVHRWKPVLIKSVLQCHRIAIANTRSITEYFPIPGGKQRTL